MIQPVCVSVQAPFIAVLPAGPLPCRTEEVFLPDTCFSAGITGGPFCGVFRRRIIPGQFVPAVRYRLEILGPDHLAQIGDLFAGVFTAETWNDDWSDRKQLDLYLLDLTGQSNSLTYGLYEDGELIGVSMGHIKHWYGGTEYCVEEFYIKTDRQGRGIGKVGLERIFLQTEKTVPAYGFYRKNGFCELQDHVSFVKELPR